MQRGEHAAIGHHDVANAIDDGLGLVCLLREACDGEVALVYLNETDSAQHHAAWHTHTSADGHQFPLINFRFSDLDLEQRRAGILGGGSRHRRGL